MRKSERSIYIIIILVFISCFIIHQFQKPPVSPIDVYASDIDLPPTAEIISYIAKTFEPEGTRVVLWAINCFYSESKLRPDAYNYNDDGTEDRGIAQINSIWGMTPEDAHNYRKNIDMAYQIYKQRGTQAWYASGCN